MEGNAMEARPRTEHTLKLMEQYVRPVLEGSMRYQVRNADRGFQAGDTVRFDVVDMKGGDFDPSRSRYCTIGEVMKIQMKRYRVDYVTAMDGLQAGFVVFSISPIPVEGA